MKFNVDLLKYLPFFSGVFCFICAAPGLVTQLHMVLAPLVPAARKDAAWELLTAFVCAHAASAPRLLMLLVTMVH